MNPIRGKANGDVFVAVMAGRSLSNEFGEDYVVPVIPPRVTKTHRGSPLDVNLRCQCMRKSLSPN